MLTMIIADYRARLKLKNIMKVLNISFIPIIYTFLLPLWNKGIEDKFILWSTLIGVINSVIISQLLPFELSEIMYLVPMTAEDKHKYLKTAYWVRSTFIIVLSTALLLAAGIIDRANIVIVSVAVIDNLLVGLTSNAALPSANQTDNKGRRLEYTPYSIKYTAILIFLVLGSLIMLFLSDVDMSWDNSSHGIILKIIIIYQVIITVCAVSFIIRNWRMVIDNALTFEKTSYVSRAKDRKR